MSLMTWKSNGKMSRGHAGNVSEVVENYRKRYPGTERRALRKLILGERKDINPRTLDRHLRIAFKPQTGKSPVDTISSDRYSEYSKRLEEISLTIVSDPDLARRELLAFMPSLPMELRSRASIEFSINEALEKDKARVLSNMIIRIRDMLDRIKRK
jgi:hypothetical protein